jgi:hypothetical protein
MTRGGGRVYSASELDLGLDISVVSKFEIMRCKKDKSKVAQRWRVICQRVLLLV